MPACTHDCRVACDSSLWWGVGGGGEGLGGGGRVITPLFETCFPRTNPLMLEKHHTKPGRFDGAAPDQNQHTHTHKKKKKHILKPTPLTLI